MAVKFLQNLYPNMPELNRVQANVAEALRQLESSLSAAQESCCARGRIIAGTPTNVPSGLVIAYQFSGFNAANNWRYMFPNNLGMDISANTGELITDTTQVLMPYAGVLQMMHVQMTPGYPNGGLPGNETRFTIRKNGVGNNAAYDTNFEVFLNVLDVGRTGFDNNVNTVTVAAGDKIGLTNFPSTMNGAGTESVYVTFFLVVS